MLLFSEKHSDYFNRSESLVYSLKVSAVMLFYARPSIKRGILGTVRQEELQGLPITFVLSM